MRPFGTSTLLFEVPRVMPKLLFAIREWFCPKTSPSRLSACAFFMSVLNSKFFFFFFFYLNEIALSALRERERENNNTQKMKDDTMKRYVRHFKLQSTCQLAFVTSLQQDSRLIYNFLREEHREFAVVFFLKKKIYNTKIHIYTYIKYKYYVKQYIHQQRRKQGINIRNNLVKVRYNRKLAILSKALTSLGLFDKWIPILLKHHVDDDSLPYLKESHFDQIQGLSVGDKIKFFSWLAQYQYNYHQQLQQWSRLNQLEVKKVANKPSVSVSRGDSTGCVDCREHTANMLASPCNHLALCETCAKLRERSNACVVCNQKSVTFIKIFRFMIVFLLHLCSCLSVCFIFFFFKACLENQKKFLEDCDYFFSKKKKRPL
ncbi:hypothetical protein RFI_33119 [Reticulomyxa filosa]|uniref:RING-type domain-containing protein n=1 Tax=Reticulomyxa filosa TaxID=46433 RepID=X6LT37_RETFI|nr:hypothetical protein RFI_33119 [Reticulomyxa filosa]|eukprot:ETO04277.1 hypothetical protein RFI_33119 [Reticulomyxa filosa]